MEYVGQSEAARACGVSQSTISRLVERGIIATDEVPGLDFKKNRLIRREYLDAFLARGCPRPGVGRPRKGG